MHLHAKALVFGSLMVFGCASRETISESPVDIDDVRQVRLALQIKDYDEKQEKRRQYLIRMGVKVFPAYEAIISDPKSRSDDVSAIFYLLREVEGDRSRFIKYALSRFTDKDYHLRWAAAALIERIGSPTEAAPLLALLSDEHREVAFAAARALRSTGGPNEVLAMDVWLRGVSHRDDQELREHIQKCHDELKKRLEGAKRSSE